MEIVSFAFREEMGANSSLRAHDSRGRGNSHKEVRLPMVRRSAKTGTDASGASPRAETCLSLSFSRFLNRFMSLLQRNLVEVRTILRPYPATTYEVTSLAGTSPGHALRDSPRVTRQSSLLAVRPSNVCTVTNLFQSRGDAEVDCFVVPPRNDETGVILDPYRRCFFRVFRSFRCQDRKPYGEEHVLDHK